MYTHKFYPRLMALLLTALVGIAMLSAGQTVHSQEKHDPPETWKIKLWEQPDEAPLPLLSDIALTPPPAAQTTTAADQPPWNQVVFQSYRDGNWEIYMINPDGSHPRRLTHNDAPDMYPRLHPNLESILYVSKSGDQSHIYRMKYDGSDPVQLGPPYWKETYPAWSPDGKRIIFSRYKNEHWALFMMNADGTGERRLTNPSDGHDIEAAWSPDGSQIAWIRRKSGGYGDIMIMHLGDGKQRVFLANRRYVQHVLWSPDGKYLAFDMDVNNDQWNDLVMADVKHGRTTDIAYAPGPMVDLWAGSWSPDSQNLLYTQVQYVVQDNQLYIARAELGRVQARWLGRRTPIPGSGLDMLPDWRLGIDHEPPTASIEPLPSISPNPIHLRWSGKDAGRAGIHSFDVQVRIDGGAWTTWLTRTTDTEKLYDGEKGRSYAFRVRAWDNAGNHSDWTPPDAAVTTIETLPPRSEFVNLPRYISTQSGVLTWQGEDPGGSGIREFQVQYREAGSMNWQYLFKGSADTSVEVRYMRPAHNYYVRVRAIDRAGNEEPWDEQGQGPITGYQWGAFGKVLANRGLPVPDATVNSHPQPWLTIPSDDQGQYAIYVNDWSGNYTVSWHHPALNSVPPTTYPLRFGDAHQDVTLPPIDDLLQNGTFEQREQGWRLDGSHPPQITDERYTGHKAMAFGSRPRPDLRIHTPNDAYHLIVQRDASDNLHLLWDDRRDFSDYTLMYARIRPDGSLAEKRELGAYGGYRAMAVSADGHVYILWVSPDMDYRYALVRRTPNGDWSQPQRLEERHTGVVAATDAENTLHLYFRNGDYMQCTPAGVCSSPEDVGNYNDFFNQNMTVTPRGDAYFAWFTEGSLSYPITPSYFYFRIRYAEGQWTPIYRFPASYDPLFAGNPLVQIQVDSQSNIHFLMPQVSSKNAVAIYARRQSDGRVQVKPIKASHSGYFFLIPGQHDIMYIAGATGQYGRLTLHYLQIAPDGQIRVEEQQQVPKSMAEDIWEPGSFQFAADSQGRIYAAAMGQSHVFNDGVHVAIREAEGEWRFWRPFGGRSCTVSKYYAWEIAPQIILDSKDVMQLLWTGESPHCDLFHASSLTQQDEEAILSQQVTIPADMPAPTLSLYARTNGAPGASTPLQISIQDAAGTSAPILSLTEFSDWRHYWVDMTRWRGQTITLTVNLTQNQGEPLRWGAIDDISLGSGAYADGWVAVAAQIPPASASEITFDLHYGNAGPDPAHNVRITYTLPPGAAFQSAEPPPTEQSGGEIWWDRASLATGTQERIRLTLTLPSSQPGDVIKGGLAINASESDLRPGNNQRDAYVFIDGASLFLPKMQIGN